MFAIPVSVTLSLMSAALGNTPADETERITALEAEVAQLERRDWLEEQRSAEIQAVVEGVLADADSRASLLQDVILFDAAGKLSFGSADGSFRATVHGQMQVRYVFNHQDSAPGNSTDSSVSGMEMRRTKIWLQGQVFDPSLTFKVKADFDPQFGGNYVFQEVFTRKAWGDFAVQAGQFKAPFLKSQLVSSMHQTAVDRELVNKRFDQNFPIGVQFSGEYDDWRWFVMPHDGITVQRSPWNAYGNEYAFSARFEAKAGGTWEQFERYASRPGSERGLVVGAAMNYESQEYGAGPPLPFGVDNEIEYLAGTVDALYHGSGWHAFGAFVIENADNDADGPDRIDQTSWGLVVQAGVFATDDLQLFARYEYGEGDDDPTAGLNIITVGFNRYFGDHLKWSFDVGYGIDPLADFWTVSTVGWRADTAGKDGQLVIRSQLQLTF